MRGLTTDLTRGELRPYFFWDEDVSIDELRAALAGPDGPVRDHLLGKMLREARDTDVWRFVTPAEVARVLPRLGRRLGRRLAFWRFLIDGWRADGPLRLVACSGSISDPTSSASCEPARYPPGKGPLNPGSPRRGDRFSRRERAIVRTCRSAHEASRVV